MPAKTSIQLGELLFSFHTFDDWVSKASRIWRRHNVRAADTICIDQQGRIIGWGKHFMTARDDGAFPVDVYRLRKDMQP